MIEHAEVDGFDKCCDRDARDAADQLGDIPDNEDPGEDLNDEIPVDKRSGVPEGVDLQDD